jgi:hypothetical protein
MDYLKVVLSGLAALFLAECIPGPWSVFRGLSQEKATGLMAFRAELEGSMLSPTFWILAIVLFALFLAASRLGNRASRILLFWLPAVTLSLLGVASAAITTYILVHFRQP